VSTSQSLFAQAESFFEGSGYTPAQANGIAAGLSAESNLNAGSVNSIGATGIAQWLGPRLQNLLNEFGPNPSFNQQLQFVAQELPSNGGGVISNDTSSQQALSDFIGLFERPCPGQSGVNCSAAAGDINRGSSALSQFGTAEFGATTSGTSGGIWGTVANLADQPAAFLAGFGLPSSNSPLSNPATATAGSIGAAVSPGNIFGPLISWLNQQEASFSKAFPNALERWVFGIVAILLIGIGLWYLMGGPQKVQVAVNTASHLIPAVA
jgi:hypothetical protein